MRMVVRFGLWWERIPEDPLRTVGILLRMAPQYDFGGPWVVLVLY